MTKTKLNIFEYTDYRKFLDDRFKELKAENKKYSRRFFIRRLGLSSSSYLTRIINSTKNLSERLLSKFPDLLALDPDQATFFTALVRYNQAKTTETKAEALSILRRYRRFNQVHKMDLEHFDYMSDPLTLALREMVNYGHFQEDPEWIASQLSIKATPKQVRKALDKLLDLGLIERDKEGRLGLADTHIASGNNFGSIPLRMYHRNMIKAGAEAMELPTDIRYFRGLTMSIPSDTYTRIINEYDRFIERIRDIVDTSEDPDNVYHMEMMLFPLARNKDTAQEPKTTRAR